MKFNSDRWFVPNTQFLVLGLGINCTIGYGTLFYSFSLLSIELENHFNWSREFIFGIYSLGILLSGLASPLYGKWLDKYRTRLPMTIGSFIVALSLCALAFIQTAWQFAIAMMILEAVSILVLYESAFTALSHSAGKKARLPITQITLMAGFASTLFWPAVSWVLDWSDWRTAYWLMAALHLFICLPIHWVILKPISSRNKIKHNSSEDKVERYKHKKTQQKSSKRQHSYFLETSIAFCLGFAAFTINSLQIHLFRIMESLQIPDQLALLAGVFVGPFQVIARIVDMAMGRYITPIQLGIFSFFSMSAGLLLLVAASQLEGGLSKTTLLFFAACFGIGQGLSYIVRGAIPLVLFDPQYYGTITGRMNGIRMVMTAVAPFSFALMMDSIGAIYSLYVLTFILFICIGVLFKINTYSHL